MNRTLALIYGLFCYSMFFLTFLYAVGFIGNLVVPRTLDSPATTPLGLALAINLALLGLFAVQHSVMARPEFKQWWTRWVPEPVERSTYVLFSSLALLLLFWFWQPISGVIWDVAWPAGRIVLYALFALGWVLVFVATCLISHFDLFGLRQVWLYYWGQPNPPLRFVTPWLYRWVRHPLYVGWILAFWATPTMTASHLLFSLVTTAYILIAVRLEERDLLAVFGGTYAEYRRRVPMLIPLARRSRRGQAGDSEG